MAEIIFVHLQAADSSFTGAGAASSPFSYTIAVLSGEDSTFSPASVLGPATQTPQAASLVKQAVGPVRPAAALAAQSPEEADSPWGSQGARHAGVRHPLALLVGPESVAYQLRPSGPAASQQMLIPGSSGAQVPGGVVAPWVPAVHAAAGQGRARQPLAVPTSLAGRLQQPASVQQTLAGASLLGAGQGLNKAGVRRGPATGDAGIGRGNSTLAAAGRAARKRGRPPSAGPVSRMAAGPQQPSPESGRVSRRVGMPRDAAGQLHKPGSAKGAGKRTKQQPRAAAAAAAPEGGSGSVCPPAKRLRADSRGSQAERASFMERVSANHAMTVRQQAVAVGAKLQRAVARRNGSQVRAHQRVGTLDGIGMLHFEGLCELYQSRPNHFADNVNSMIS